MLNVAADVSPLVGRIKLSVKDKMKLFHIVLVLFTTLSGCAVRRDANIPKIAADNQFNVRIDGPSATHQYFEVMIGGGMVVQSQPVERTFRIGNEKVGMLTDYVAEHFAGDRHIIDDSLKNGQAPRVQVFMISISYQTTAGKSGDFSIIRKEAFTKTDLNSVRALFALIDSEAGFMENGATRILDQWLPIVEQKPY